MKRAQIRGVDGERVRPWTAHVSDGHLITPETPLPAGGHGPGGIPSADTRSEDFSTRLFDCIKGLCTPARELMELKF